MLLSSIRLRKAQAREAKAVSSELTSRHRKVRQQRPVELLFDNLPEPVDLLIDQKEQRLYRTDRGDFPKGNSLNVAYIPSLLSDRQDYDILARHMHDAIGIAIDKVNSHIFVSDLGGSVYRYDVDGTNRQNFFEDQGVYTGIALAHLESQQVEAMYSLE